VASFFIVISCNAAESSMPQRTAITLIGPDKTRTGHFNLQHVDANSGRSLISHLDDRPGILASVSYRSETEPSKVLHKIKEGRALYAQLQAGGAEHANVIDVRYYLVDQEPNGAIVGRYIDPNIIDYSKSDPEKGESRLSFLMQDLCVYIAIMHYLDVLDVPEAAARLYERAYDHTGLNTSYKHWLAMELVTKFVEAQQHEAVIRYGLKMINDRTVEPAPRALVLSRICRAYAALTQWDNLIATGKRIFNTIVIPYPLPGERDTLECLEQAYRYKGIMEEAATCQKVISSLDGVPKR
jgi:hypothetical protein